MGHKQPGRALIHQHRRMGNEGRHSQGAQGCPPVSGHGAFLCCPPLRGSASLFPPGARTGQSPAPWVWLLPLCRPWPLAGAPGPGGPHRRCPQLGPHRATGSRKGGWGWGEAPSPGCPASLPGSSPSGSRPSLAAVGDLPCLGGSEGAAAGENPPAPPAAEGGKGKGAREPSLSPDRRHQPAGARAKPGAAGRASISRTGLPRPPSLGPAPAPCPPGRPPPARLAAPGEGKKGPILPPQPRGECGRLRAAEPGAAPPTGSAGRGRGRGRAGRARPQAAAVRPPAASRRPIYPERVGGEPGSALPFPRPPSSAPAAHFQALPRRGVLLAPPACPLPLERRPPRRPEATPAHGGTPRPSGEGPPHSPTRHHQAVVSFADLLHFCLSFPSFLSDFPLSSDFRPSFTPSLSKAAFPLSVKVCGHEGRALLKSHRPSSL